MLVVALPVLALACGGPLSADDQASLKDAARLTGMAYRYLDGGPPRALDRGAHCAVQAVLRRQKLGEVEAGIPCTP